jgi:hypothetical protein
MRVANELLLNCFGTENQPLLGDLAQVSAPELTLKHVERDPALTDPSQAQNIDLV